MNEKLHYFEMLLRSHSSLIRLIAELQRAKRASEAPWVRKIGNPSSRENLVMTSVYERPYVRTDSGGGGGASHGHPYGKPANAIFPRRVFCLEKSEKHSFLFAISTNDRRG